MNHTSRCGKSYGKSWGFLLYCVRCRGMDAGPSAGSSSGPYPAGASRPSGIRSAGRNENRTLPPPVCPRYLGQSVASGTLPRPYFHLRRVCVARSCRPALRRRVDVVGPAAQARRVDGLHPVHVFDPRGDAGVGEGRRRAPGVRHVHQEGGLALTGPAPQDLVARDRVVVGAVQLNTMCPSAFAVAVRLVGAGGGLWGVCWSSPACSCSCDEGSGSSSSSSGPGTVTCTSSDSSPPSSVQIPPESHGWPVTRLNTMSSAPLGFRKNIQAFSSPSSSCRLTLLTVAPVNDTEGVVFSNDATGRLKATTTWACRPRPGGAAIGMDCSAVMP